MAEQQPISGINGVIVGNNREYFSPLDRYIPDTPVAAKAEFLRSDIDEADMDIMWKVDGEGDNKLVLLPETVDSAFVQDVSNTFGYRNVHVASPEDRGLGLSRNIIADPGTYTLITDSLRQSPRPAVIPWGQTPEYQKLTEKLQREGVVFRAPETPERRSLWTPDYLDTKIGSREVLQKARERDSRIKIAEGFVAPNIDTAMQIAGYFLYTKRGVVFKANLGGSGVGVSVFPPTEFGKNQDANHQKIDAIVRQNPLLQAGPMVVEEYIPPNFSHHGVFPSVDSVISPDGSLSVKAVDAMVIHHDAEVVGFYGCVLGKGLFTEEQNQRLKGMSKTIGEELVRLTYRGWFDIDYILSTSGDFYATEVNLRRTSICYMLELGELLFGEDYESKIAMRSNDKYIRPNLAGLSYADLKAVLDPVLYPMGEQQRGIIITQSFRSMLGRGKFGYVSIGTDQDDTRAIEMELDQRLQAV